MTYLQIFDHPNSVPVASLPTPVIHRVRRFICAGFNYVHTLYQQPCCLWGKQDEVLAINEKVVVRADDLLSWMCVGTEWRWGLRAVWRGACAPPTDMPRHAPLTHTKLDFSDVDNEKSAIAMSTFTQSIHRFFGRPLPISIHVHAHHLPHKKSACG
ncbi:hypothetical protein B5X24_HaOG214939 [Helicoverpa armigera]|uniref:Uncharacterized protein n=1 Tax=Helicoverpa armigera TaxID=29058 RepID=A0A2W1B608_HELAM|nr:hypothetical protein B5X24_HaOG214939 [Helicoverpa armigera]